MFGEENAKRKTDRPDEQRQGVKEDRRGSKAYEKVNPRATVEGKSSGLRSLAETVSLTPGPITVSRKVNLWEWGNPKTLLSGALKLLLPAP